MNQQQAFDVAYQGIKAQGKLSKHKGQCYYRHPENNQVKCAIGHLIPDEQYNPDMEEGETCVVLVRTRHQLPDITDLSGEFLIDLQNVHDGARSVSECLRNLDGLASQYELQPYQGIAA